MTTPPPPRATTGKLFQTSLILGAASALIIPLNIAVLFLGHGDYFVANLALALLQFVLGTIAAVLALMRFKRAHGLVARGWVLALSIAATLVGLCGAGALFVGVGALAALAKGNLFT